MLLLPGARQCPSAWTFLCYSRSLGTPGSCPALQGANVLPEKHEMLGVTTGLLLWGVF